MSDRKLTPEQLNEISFVDLNHKTHFSLLAGVGSIKDHYKAAQELGHKGFSLADKGNMSGVLELYNIGKKEKFPFILATEMYIDASFGLAKELGMDKNNPNTINLYAKNAKGFSRLSKLSSLSTMPDHFDYENGLRRISLEEIFEETDGLVCSMGTQDSCIANSILKEDGLEGKFLDLFKEKFGEDFYVEIHPHNLAIFWDKDKKRHDMKRGEDPQSKINKVLIPTSRDKDIKMFITCYPHLTKKTDHIVQQVMLKNDRANKDGWFMHEPYYMRTVAEIYDLIQKRCSYIGDSLFVELCENSMDVLNKCKDIKLNFEPKLPDIDYDEHVVNSDPELSKKLEKELDDLEKKYLKDDPAFSKLLKISKKDQALRNALKITQDLAKIDFNNKDQRERFTYEVNIIQRNGVIQLIDYFLLLEDVSNFVRNEGYLRGFGRGSGAGSIFAYCTDITDCEPLKFDLLFERFLTQERIGTILFGLSALDYEEFQENYEPEDIASYIERGTDSKIFLDLKKALDMKKLEPYMQESFDREIFFLECNEYAAAYLMKLKEILKGKKIENENSSAINYLLGLTDEKPSEEGIKRTETTLPDIDYDSDARDPIKQYLIKKYGFDRVTLLGTFGTLKTKGAIKDVMRQLRPNVGFDQVNQLTKKFDGLEKKEIGFKKSIDFFKYSMKESDALRKWFMSNPDVKDAVEKALGNVKNTGIHAGGIVVTSADVTSTIPMQYIDKENMWATQGEMTYVEAAGLIKFDFLGLKTLEHLNQCMKLIKERHGKEYKLSEIPLTHKDILMDFPAGKTESVFQFSTPLATAILTQLKEVTSVDDLAIITSIARPGPLNMKMDKTFIKRNNGLEPIAFVHESLEEILKDTYGILVYQEQVMKVVRKLGGLTGDESLVVMKAMSKKKQDVIDSFKDRFIETAKKEHKVPVDKANEIWDLLAAFAEYGFNRSHAIAYACASYYCMYFKEKYLVEWIAAVLSASDKEDFKELYKKWKDNIKKPDINESKSSFMINSDNLVVMPLSSVNGVGNAAVETIVAHQPYSSFEDFYGKVDKRRITKAVFYNLIFSGCFDSLKPSKHYSESKWRKELYVKFYKLKFKEKKPSLKAKRDAEKEVEKVAKMNPGEMLIQEISTLNFTSFDYYDHYYDKMTNGAKKYFGVEARRPEEVMDLPDKHTVVVGGAVEAVKIVAVKSGKTKGKDMMFLTLCNEGKSIDITVFANSLEDDVKAGGKLKNIKEFTPIIVKGNINHYNGRISIVFSEGWILV